MKIVSLLALSVLLSFSLLQAEPRGSQGGAKITKNEAEHIALKHHKDSRVTAAKLEKVDGKLVWSIEIEPAKGKHITLVTVDARSGHILSDKKADR